MLEEGGWRKIGKHKYILGVSLWKSSQIKLIQKGLTTRPGQHECGGKTCLVSGTEATPPFPPFHLESIPLAILKWEGLMKHLYCSPTAGGGKIDAEQ